VDRRGFVTPAGADNLLGDVRTILGGDAPHFDHPDGRQFLFDLRPYRDRMRQELGDRYSELARAEAEAVRMLWLRGFMSHAAVGEEWKHHAGAADGVVAFVNPSDRPRTLHLEVVFRTTWEEVGDLRIEGGVWSDHFPVNKDSPLRTYEITVPPGTHVVRLRFRPPAGKTTNSNRRHVYFAAMPRPPAAP
jgi:hypothetical protein